jgi:hypothetical protein
MRALEASGDATAALEHARRHAATVQTELGAVPADVVAFMGAAAHTRRPATRWRPPPAPPPWPPRFRDVPATHPEAALGAVPQAAPALSVLRLRRPPRWLMALLVGLRWCAVSWARWADHGQYLQGRDPQP